MLPFPLFTHLFPLLGIGWSQYLERAKEVLADGHHSSRVVELAAVVGRRKHRHQLPVRHELVPILYNLMCAAYEIQVVTVQKLFDDIRPECKADSAIVIAPAMGFDIRIAPQYVAIEAFGWDVRGTLDSPVPTTEGEGIFRRAYR